MDAEFRDRILAHRGLWNDAAPPNSPKALDAALRAGFGIETDIRDMMGKLVISHDPALAGAEDAAILSDLISERADFSSLIALNIKSDGLAGLAKPLLTSLSERNAFCFDMSFPDTRSYIECDIPILMRVSEWEPINWDFLSAYGLKPRFWLDSFTSDWWLSSSEASHICSFGQVVAVSPELHGRAPERVWEWFAQEVSLGHDVYLCTDLPYSLSDFLV